MKARIFLTAARRIAANALLAAAVALPVAATGCRRAREPGAAASRPVIAVIPKSTNNPYWKAVEAGAEKAERETGCEIRWVGPTTEADRQAQIRIVADMLGQGVDAMCIAPNDQDALVNTVVQAQQKVPVVVFDSGINTQDYTAFIATDNRKGGEIAGNEMLKLLGDKSGTVAVIRGIAGSESTTDREEGFIDALKKNSKLRIVDLRGDNEEGKSRQAAADLLTREGNIIGFFGCSEPACKGILGALKDAGKVGSIRFVGFDGGDELAAGLDRHQIDALVVQRPVLMGELAVRAAVAAVRHEPVEKLQRIDPMLITQDNKDRPEVRELLAPKTR